MKKKLLIFIPHIKGGGVEKNFFILANYLATKIKSVSVITVNKEYKNKLDKKIKIISLKTKIWNESSIYIKYIISISLLLKTLLNDKEYLILSFQANWYAILITKIFGVKIISRSNTAPNGWSKNIIKRYFYKLILNLADKIIVNSIEFKKILKKKFNVDSVCIYNPLNTKYIKNKSKEKLNFNFFNNNKLKLINIGRCTDQKNQILILKAIKYLKKRIPIRLLIAGDGKEFLNLRSYIKSNKLDGQAKLLNYLNNPYKYINKANIFILSSNYEGLPNVLLEAQYLKKIIISTNCPTGPKEILLNGKAGVFFKMNNYKDLAKKIEKIYIDKAKYKEKTIIGYNNLHRFNERINLNKYFILIKKYLI